MKASSLWPGTDYAYEDYHGRGRPLPLDAKCVKVLEVVQEPIPGGKRKRTKVFVAFMTDDGDAITEGIYGQPRWVKAEDIFEFWEEYEQQREPLLEEKIRRDALEAIERERREKAYEERQAITAVAFFIRNFGQKLARIKAEEKAEIEREEREKKLTRIRNVLVTRGFEKSKINFSNGYLMVRLDEIERWLGI